ncbi:MAG: methyl-accepting chemotaxis protein [Ignavibacteria bacterium]|nr:methyl-accepting chemotaxis protein [Ignavibacteria bacterium]
MKISMKLFVSFGLILILLVAFAIFAPVQMASLSTYLEQVKNESLKKVLLLNDVKDNQNIIARALRNLLLTNDPKIVEDEWNRVLESRNNITKLLSEINKLVRSDREKELFDSIKNIRGSYIEGQKKIYELRKQNKIQEAVEFLLSDFRKIQNVYFGRVNQLIEDEIKQSDQMITDSKNLVSTSRTILFGAGLIGVILGLVLAGVISRNISKPINKAADASNKIARGNINVDLETTTKDETAILMSSMKRMVENISSMVNDVKMLAKAAIEGKLDVRADSSKYEGEFKELIDGFNATLDAVIGPLNVAAEYIDRVSKGDIPPKITDEYKGDFNEIKNNLNNLIENLNYVSNIAENISNGNLDIQINERSANDTLMISLKNMSKVLKSVINDIYSIVEKARKGYLNYRCETTGHKGEYLRLVGGINETLDILTNIFDYAGNFMVADSEGNINYLNKSQYEFLAKYENEYRKNYPDFSVSKVIGTHIDRWHKNPTRNRQILSGLVSSHEARISIGDQIMRLIINPLKDKNNQILGYVVQWNNYTNETNLENELTNIVKNVLNGNLKVRVNVQKFFSNYIDIANQINNMLDAIINPLNVAANYIERISKGDIPPKITDEYKGDFNEIKNNINILIDSISRVVNDTLTLGKALAEGNLDIRVDSSQHQGTYKNIIETINTAVDNIAEPLQETGNVVNLMKDGDLTVRMFGQYLGELKRLKDNINIMADSLNQLLLQISSSADISATAAAQISAIAETLAASAAENSAQVDEIATAIEEMSRTIAENAMGATRAAEVADKNKKIAAEGGNAVQQTVSKMNEIASVVRASADKIEKLGESSKQIGEIISVIDEIADQTNLLALNAAIEAARAGEQGRGFAVVADEVRKLAERTTEATKQIAQMIKGIQKETEEAVRAMKQGTDEVNSGIVLADKAGTALKEIMQSSQEVWDMINQIAAATEEQSSTAEQVAKNVSSISQVTSDTANRVQDIAKSAEDLAKQTDILRTLLEKFKLQKEGQSAHLEGKDARKLSGKGSRYLGSGETH